MPKHDDGGPAFPKADFILPDGTTEWANGGMTLLDWFAGQTLVALLANPRPGPDEYARDAYVLAAAMVVEKRRREESEG